MQTLLDILAMLFLTIGLFFMLVGAVGLVRLPDTYNRLHAASKCTTLGLLGMLIAVVCHVHNLDVLLMVVLTVVFAFVAVPVGSHILAKAALHDKVPKWEGTLSDERPED